MDLNVIIEGFREEHSQGRVRISADFILEGKKSFACGKKKEKLYFDFPENYCGYTGLTADPFALVALTVAINTGEDLTILEKKISSQLYLNLLEIMHVYQWFFPRKIKIIDIHCSVENRMPENKERIGSFFSGGIDSLYNIAEMKRLHDQTGMDQVTDLWIVHGMDIPIDNDDKWETVHSRLKEMSKTVPHKSLIDIKTNVKSVMDGLLRYNDTGTAIVLGAISKCFAGQVSTVLIGSYGLYNEVIPHSTSPFIDPFFSCDQQQVRHFTCRASRLEKEKCVFEILPEVIKDVRVCTNDDSQDHNCGRCEKCFRTKAEFLIVGIPLSATDFSDGISATDILKISFPVREEDRELIIIFWKEIMRGLIRKGYWKMGVAVWLRLQANFLYLNLRLRTWRKRTRGFRDWFKSFSNHGASQNSMR